MSASTVRFNVRLAVHDGKLDAFEAVVRQMTAATLKEPGTLAYEFYPSGDRKECHLLESYQNADAVLAHMNGPAVQEFVPKMLEVSSLTDFHIYGDPGTKAAEIVSGMGAKIFGRWVGMGR